MTTKTKKNVESLEKSLEASSNVVETLEQLEAYKLQQHKKKGVKTNGSSTKRTKQFEQQIPADDEKDEEYYRLLEECERLSRE